MTSVTTAFGSRQRAGSEAGACSPLPERNACPRRPGPAPAWPVCVAATGGPRSPQLRSRRRCSPRAPTWPQPARPQIQAGGLLPWARRPLQTEQAWGRPGQPSSLQRVFWTERASSRHTRRVPHAKPEPGAVRSDCGTKAGLGHFQRQETAARRLSHTPKPQRSPAWG